MGDDLLAAVIAAHGGAERWAAVEEVAFHQRAGGFALASKARRRAFADAEVRVATRAPRTVFPDWPAPGQRGVFEPDRVWIESREGEVREERHDPRAAFHGLLTVRWDRLHLLYFAGYALWGYLTQPFLLLRPGFESREIEPWSERGETWRRMVVTFPADVPAHSREQVYYFDSELRLRRNDYTAEVFGRWARGAHYSDEHVSVDGLLFPTRRRVYPRSPRNRPLRFPTLVSLDFSRLSAGPAR